MVTHQRLWKVYHGCYFVPARLRNGDVLKNADSVCVSVCGYVCVCVFKNIAREHCHFERRAWQGLRPSPPLVLGHQHAQRAVSLNKSHQSSTWQGLALFASPPHTPLALLINHSLSDGNKGGKWAGESFLFISLFFFSANVFEAALDFPLRRRRCLLSLSRWHIV